MNIVKQSRKLDVEEIDDSSDSDMEIEDTYFDGQKTPEKQNNRRRKDE